MKNAHRLRKMEILDETVRHFDALGFHRMVLTENVFRYLLVIDVCYWLHVDFLINIYMREFPKLPFILTMSINNRHHGSINTRHNQLPIYFLSFYGVMFCILDVHVLA